MTTVQTAIITEPRVHMWTSDEYYKMTEAGLFDGKRVELIVGEVIDKDDVPKVHLWTREEYYWVINLKKRQTEVYRNPVTDALAPFGFKYRDKLIFKEGDHVSPLAKPEASIAVADLLP